MRCQAYYRPGLACAAEGKWTKGFGLTGRLANAGTTLAACVSSRRAFIQAPCLLLASLLRNVSSF